MTFADWIKTLPVTNDPRGDFIGDTQMLIEIGRLPAITSWEKLEFFLWERKACAEAVRQGERLWDEYAAMEIER